MDDDDFDSELLGGLQRQHNLRQNEATRQEIAALRADLKRKEAAEKLRRNARIAQVQSLTGL